MCYGAQMNGAVRLVPLLGFLTFGCATGDGGTGTEEVLVGSTTQALAAEPHQAPTLTPQVSGTLNRLHAVSPVDSQVVWACGAGGTYARTTDGGETWESHVVPGAETLLFRDVEGISADVAYLLASGLGTNSRIYKTEDGGETWTLQIQNDDPNGFWDCFAFWSATEGLTMVDSADGRFPVIRTLDGESWQDIGDNLPAPLPGGEFAFAASGTCMATVGDNWAWIGTGGGAEARILARRGRRLPACSASTSATPSVVFWEEEWGRR